MFGTEVIEKTETHSCVVHTLFTFLSIAEIIKQVLPAWSSDSMTCPTMWSMYLSLVQTILVLWSNIKCCSLLIHRFYCMVHRCLLAVLLVSCVGGCSLWRRWHCCCCCCRRANPGGGSCDDDPSSERESVVSCYPPPQYSRCSSFHHAPPPYTEVRAQEDYTEMPDLCRLSHQTET